MQNLRRMTKKRGVSKADGQTMGLANEEFALELPGDPRAPVVLAALLALAAC